MTIGEENVADRLTLLDWKRRIFALYGAVREAPEPRAAWDDWRAGRDELFASHPQSPLRPADRKAFRGLDYFTYEPRLRLRAEVVAAPLTAVRIGSSGTEPIESERFAYARFSFDG